MNKITSAVTVLSLAIIALVGAWLLTQLRPKAPVTTITASTVITQLQQLQRLETAVFTMEQVVEADTAADKAVWQKVLFGDKLLLIAHGQVVAGVDFAKLEEADIQVTDSSVSMKLPAPEIFAASLDESKTRVYDRDTGLFTKGELDLEAQARESAVGLLEQAACEGEILDLANQHAQQQMEALLKALQFEQVEVTTQAGSC